MDAEGKVNTAPPGTGRDKWRLEASRLKDGCYFVINEFTERALAMDDRGHVYVCDHRGGWETWSLQERANDAETEATERKLHTNDAEAEATEEKLDLVPEVKDVSRRLAYLENCRARGVLKSKSVAERLKRLEQHAQVLEDADLLGLLSGAVLERLKALEKKAEEPHDIVGKKRKK